MNSLKNQITGVLQNYVGTELIEKGGGPNIQCGCDLLQMAPSENLPTALYNLGVLYERGHLRSNSPNFPRAAQCYERASKLQHAGAKYNLGVLYAKGNSVVKDIQRAKSLIYEAALIGLPQARAIVFSNKS